MRLNALLIGLTLLTLIFISASTRADFALGMQYYEKGNFEKAYEEFIEAAKHGEYSAQFNLGAMYYRGEHVQKDLTQSYAWFALAAQDNLYKEQSTHTKIFNKLSDEEKNKAEENYQKLLTEFSDEKIRIRLTPELSGSTPFIKKMRSIKKVAPSYPSSMLEMGKSGWVDMYYTVDKHGVTRDHVVYYSPDKAFTTEAIKSVRQWRYEPTLINGKAVSVNGVKSRLTFQIDSKNSKKEEIKKLVEGMKLKAKTGDANDKFAYAYLLDALPSYTSEYDFLENPNEWYLSAANSGSTPASFILGVNTLYGNMCSPDSTKSMGWLIKASSQNSSEAQYTLAIELLSGTRLEKNEDKALYWMQRAANNNQVAQLRYARILATTLNDDKRDGKLAKSYFEKVSDEYLDKQSYYQTAAAVAAENGDFKAAIKWQKKARIDAEKFELPLEEVNAQMAAYKNNKPWREEL